VLLSAALIQDGAGDRAGSGLRRARHLVSIRQRHVVELEFARQLARRACVKDHVIVDFDLRAFGGSALTSSQIDVPRAARSS